MNDTRTQNPPANAELIKVEMNQPVKNGATVGELFKMYGKSFEVIAAKNLDVARVMRVAILTVSRSQGLLECTTSSLLGAVMMMIQFGWDLAARDCYLVPFKNSQSGRREVTLIPDYRGLAKSIRRSGMVKDIQPFVVYRQDHFVYELGDRPKFEHIPKLEHDFKADDVIAAYSVATFTDGHISRDVLPRKYLISIRDRAKSKTGPWAAGGFDFAEMCKKTAIKHHSKSLPMDLSGQVAVELDHRAEMARPQNINVFAEGKDGRPAFAEIEASNDIDEDESGSDQKQSGDATKAASGKGGDSLNKIVDENRREAKSSSRANASDNKADPPKEEDLEIHDDQYTVLTDAISSANVKFGDVTDHMKQKLGYPDGCKMKQLKRKDYDGVLKWLMDKAESREQK